MITDISESFAEFASKLTQDHARAAAMGSLVNGFEKWLAFEWLLHLRAQGGLSSEQVGVEYKADLVGEHVGKQQKQIDLWVAGPRGRWHFVEIKVVFGRMNTNKILTAAGSDLWYLAHVDRKKEKACGAWLVVVGSGFDTPRSWRAAQSKIAAASELMPKPAAERVDDWTGDLRWSVWRAPG